MVTVGNLASRITELSSSVTMCISQGLAKEAKPVGNYIYCIFVFVSISIVLLQSGLSDYEDWQCKSEICRGGHQEGPVGSQAQAEAAVYMLNYFFMELPALTLRFCN